MFICFLKFIFHIVILSIDIFAPLSYNALEVGDLPLSFTNIKRKRGKEHVKGL